MIKVFEAFAGYGSQNTNREFIGIEFDEKYYKIACERLGA